MFGHQDHQQQSDNDASDQVIGDSEHLETVQPEHAADQTWQHPGTPLDDSAALSTSPPTTSPSLTDADDTHQDTHASSSPFTASSSDDYDNPNASNDLVDIKQQALGQLKPLVSHLDQSPEEKFRTTMMMIQASDDKSLVKTAYEAAKQISDEKTRAQALLDVINEINYFTQNPEK
ncbi:MAG: hypothetical protein WA843_02605 [Candidatus Saccharimonadales bacterium]